MNSDAGLGTQEARKLGGVISFHADEFFALPQNRGDFRGVERMNVLDVKVIGLDSSSGQERARLPDNAERGPPANQGHWGVQGALELRRLQFFKLPIHLFHALFHDLAAHRRSRENVADDNTFLVVLVGWRNIFRACGAGQGARRDSRWSASIALVRAVPARPIGNHFAPLDGHVVPEVIRLNGLGVLGEQEVGNDHDRKLILFCQIEGLDGGPVAVGGVGRGAACRTSFV